LYKNVEESSINNDIESKTKVIRILLRAKSPPYLPHDHNDSIVNLIDALLKEKHKVFLIMEHIGE